MSDEKTPPEAILSDETAPPLVTTPDTETEAAQPDSAGDGDNPDAGDDQDDGTDADDAKSAANKEAAKWRTKFRAAERERDELVTRLEHLQRTEAQRVAAAHLADGADVWRDGAELSRVLDDDGNVDPARVAEVAAEVAAAHPHYGRHAPTANLRRGGLASGATGMDSPRRASWSEVIRG
jgi:hypothetical protein